MSNKKPKLTKQQVEMLEALSNCYVNVSKASKLVGIDRTTHYDWVNKFPHYKELYEGLREGLLDLAEERLMLNIEDAKETSLIFFLKTKGKSRGYVERTETMISGDVEIKGYNEFFTS